MAASSADHTNSQSDGLTRRQCPPGTALVVVISGPSGVGKDTLIARMAELGYDHHFTITATTRAPRPDEADGVNHFFVTPDEFTNMIARGDLLEWAQVYGQYYGVPRRQVKEALEQGRHVMIRVDIQGARRLRALLPEALFMFVMPPSMDALRVHLEKRGVNTREEMETRLAAAKNEIAQADLFDYKVVNEENRLDETVAKVGEILHTESHRDPPRIVKL